MAQGWMLRSVRNGMRFAVSAIFAFLLAAAPANAAYFDVGKLPPPSVDGKEIAANVEQFSTDFAMRVGGSPAEESASKFLLEEAKKLGYKAEILTLSVAPNDPGTIGRAVVATRPGLTKPDENILFMGHYDNVPQTINGAYDNASGTNMIRALAKSMANVPTNRSVSFIWYSNEEQGLLASEAHAAQAAEAGMKVKAVLGFDMVGIAYPVAAPEPGRNCLCLWHGEEDEGLEPLIRHVNFGLLGLPEADGLVQFQGINSRNSDERSWDAKGYPVLRWAGMPTADTYPAYHMPDDTIATIEAQAGGRDFFEAGLRNTLLSSYSTALTLDNEMPVAKGTASGTGPIVTFDGGGSSDPDGGITRYAWDFGDGSVGSGSVVAHNYAKPGTYLAKLTVADNLWGNVTSSTVVPVTVTKGSGVTAGTSPASKPKPKAKKRPTCKKPGKRASKKKKAAYKRCLKKRKKRR
jgi:hypothetical protein